MKTQLSNIEKAKAMRDSYEAEYEREAFAAGYDHAHGIACHNVPQIGDKAKDWSYDLLFDVIETVEEAREAHCAACAAAEENARSYSPWEYVAKEINSLDDIHGEGASESAWDAYDEGVSAAIEHDLEGYDDASYGAE